MNLVDIIKNIQIPHFTMKTFTHFTSLFVFQSRGARAVFQLYPENSEQVGGKKWCHSLFYDGLCVDVFTI